MNDFPLLRASLGPVYADAPAAQLDQIVRGIYGAETSAEDVEGLFDDIGRGLSRAARSVGNFAQQAAPMIVNALPAAASGAAAGSLAGPWGTAIGAAAGLAGGLLSQSHNSTARGIGGAIGGASSLVGAVRGGGAGGAAGALGSIASGALGGTQAGRQAAQAMRPQANSGGGSANALLAMLARPELLQALQAAVMGRAGAQAVSVGGQQVPVHQMLAAFGNVAQRAAHEAAEYDEQAETTPEYAEAAAEAFGIDADDAEGRTDALLTLLALSPSIWGPRPAPVQVQVSPADPFFPAGAEYDEQWGSWEYDESAEDVGEYEDSYA